MFALIVGGSVVEIAAAEFPVHPDFVWVDTAGMTPSPAVGWTYANGAFSAPASIAPMTLAQQAIAAIGGGLAITSTSTPALDGMYPVDGSTQSHIQSEMLAVLVGGAFADGSTTVAWPDMAGAVHTFSVAEFKAFAMAVGGYVAALYKVANGTLSSLPPASVTIA